MSVPCVADRGSLTAVGDTVYHAVVARNPKARQTTLASDWRNRRDNELQGVKDTHRMSLTPLSFVHSFPYKFHLT